MTKQIWTDCVSEILVFILTSEINWAYATYYTTPEKNIFLQINTYANRFNNLYLENIKILKKVSTKFNKILKMFLNLLY